MAFLPLLMTFARIRADLGSLRPSISQSLLRRKNERPSAAGSKCSQSRDRGTLPSSAPRPSAIIGSGAVCLFLISALFSTEAYASQGPRLGGAEAQGPATPSVTALHHNPALLGSLYGFQFYSAFHPGLDLLGVRRNRISNDGTPREGFQPKVRLVNPSFGAFLGASFRLDPFAFGIGVYTLQNRLRVQSNDNLRFHLGTNLDGRCVGNCPNPRSGGMADFRTDFTFAFAWNALDSLSLGFAAHYPHLKRHFSFDNDTGQSESLEGTGCDVEGADIEDPACAERLSFTGRTRPRWFGLSPDGTRFDFVLTLGLAWEVNRKLRLGVRYRSMPVLNRGTVTLSGKARVCLGPEAVGAGRSEVPACEDTSGSTATLVERIPREIAVGSSATFGANDRWQLDTNIYWIDNCPGFTPGGRCANRDAQQLSLVGLDRNVAVLPETTVYRGFKDIIGAELWGRYTLDHALAGPRVPFCDGGRSSSSSRICIPRMDLLFGTGFESPGVRPSATNARHNDGWAVRASLGLRFRIPSRRNTIGTWYIIPGYGLDWLIPLRVGPGGEKPAFDPAAAQSFLESGGDLNGPGADALLEGRARPTNAAWYTGSLHTFSLGIRWSEDPP